jgi:inosose dehydratase
MTWNIRIGINPLSWMNDDLPSLGGETLLETALAEGREIGYEGFELGNKFPKDGPGLKAKLDEFGLACVSGWYSGFLGNDTVEVEVKRCEAHMSKLQFNQVNVVVYGECADTIQGQMDTPVSRRPRFATEAAWQAYAERLNAFGEHLFKTYGIRLAYHHHMGAYVESPEDVDKLMALTDPAKVVLLRKHVKRVVHVHCKDVRAKVIAQARNESWSFLTGVINGTFTVPGDGALDFEAVLSTLKNAGYEGWLVVEAEQDPAVAPSYEYAKKGYDTLRAIVDSLA